MKRTSMVMTGLTFMLSVTCSVAQAQHVTLGNAPWCNNAGQMNQTTGTSGYVSTYPTTANYPGYSMTVKVVSLTVSGMTCNGPTQVDGQTCIASPAVAMSPNNGTGISISKTGGLFVGRVTYDTYAYANGVQLGAVLERYVDCPQPLPCPPEGCQTPVVLPIGSNRGNQVQFSDAAHGVIFDLTGRGVYQRVAWPVDAANTGFLGIDKNHNGVIDNGSELVGGALREGSSSGWDALAKLAVTGGYITPGQPLFDSLVVWIDRNRDGISTPDEVEPASHYLARVWLSGEWVGKKDPNGNCYEWKGFVNYVDHPDDMRPVYDVTLAVQPQQ